MCRAGDQHVDGFRAAVKALQEAGALDINFRLSGTEGEAGTDLFGAFCDVLFAFA